jgi:hypothetical protein
MVYGVIPLLGGCGGTPLCLIRRTAEAMMGMHLQRTKGLGDIRIFHPCSVIGEALEV